MSSQQSLPDVFSGLVDDAAIFPPGDAPLPEAVAAYASRADEWYADLVGSFVVTDVKVPDVDTRIPLSIVVTGGAGAIGPALHLAGRKGAEVAGVEVALRDPDDLTGNARRVVAAVDAARADGVLDDETPVYVELPQQEPGADWLGAADAVAEAELRLKFRTGGLESHLFPAAPTLAALDRRGAGPGDAVQVHGRAAQRAAAHGRGRLRAPGLRQRPARDPAGVRRRRGGRGGGDPRGAGPRRTAREVARPG